MNSRLTLAPLGILVILILIGVLVAIFALLRNPNGRKILLTILTVVAVVGGILFAGFFTIRAIPFRGHGMESGDPFSGSIMLLKPLLLLLGVFMIVTVIRGVKNNKKIPILVIFLIFLVPALLFFLIIPVGHVRIEGQPSWNTPAVPSVFPSAPIKPAPHTAMVEPATKIPLPPGYETPSIWQDAIAGQFTANVYPSKAGALKALRPKIDEILRTITEGKPAPKVVLFAAGLSATEVHSLMDSTDNESVKWTVEPLPRNLQENEISIATNFALTNERTESHANQIVMKTRSGVLDVSISPSGQSSRTVLKAMVDEKPWLEDLAGFQTANPNGRFSVAKSQSTLTDEKLAEQEALAAACSTVAGVLWDMNPRQVKHFSGILSVNATDLANRGLILDRFSQQLYGVAGPICRHALLIDLSQNKIQPLANAKFALVAEQQRTWARILLSFIGMAALILVVYAFLNAATRGYYVWSLRIAAIVLLGVGVAIVLTLA